jgi:hypothetical protein
MTILGVGNELDIMVFWKMKRLWCKKEINDVLSSTSTSSQEKNDRLCDATIYLANSMAEAICINNLVRAQQGSLSYDDLSP